VALFSECHELFGGPQPRPRSRRPRRADHAPRPQDRHHLAFDTQCSRADAIPPKIVELVKLNACFAVESWRSNDRFLGDGSFQAGIRATELGTGKDVGTSILTGATAERFEIVKWFHLEADNDTGYDAAADIIARAMANLHPRHRLPGQRRRAATSGTGSARRHRDRARRRPVGRAEGARRDIPARLRSLAPDWTPYRSITGLDLRRYLQAEHGIKVPTTGVPRSS
jgi:S-DNA-T family DNA segregation ATPase FtsK/SpoIIIE